MSLASSRRPIVGITAPMASVRESDAPPIAAAYVDAAYLAAVRSAGLVPLLLPPNDPADADRVLEAVDALLLSGGEDIDPTHYGAIPHPAVGPFAPVRDMWELALVRAAYARRVPTLGICRGAQLLAVALGGSLVQHLADGDAARGARHDRVDARQGRVHAATVAPGSTLARVLGATALDVNSYHHQAIATVVPPLVAVAWSDDGVIEGVASQHAAWPAFGVQWHPEDLASDADAPERGLFAWLAEQATRHRNDNP